MIRWRKSDQGPQWWYAEIDGEMVAEAAKSGSHLDDYPWDWWLTRDKDAKKARKSSGVTDTLRSAKADVATALGMGETFE